MPQALRKPKIFYGWFIVGVVFLSHLLGNGIMNIALGAILKPMTDDTGWTRTQVTLAGTIGSISSSFLAPFSGHMADLYGPRLLMTSGSILLGGVFVGLASMQYLWQFYALYIAGRMITGNSLQGVPSSVAVVNWFVRMRGRAVGITTSATYLGGATQAFLARYLISRYGWRSVWLTFGLLTWGIVVLPCFLLLRRRPEDMGLRPDGDDPGKMAKTVELAAGKRRKVVQEEYWPVKAAVRTRAFWYLSVAFALMQFALASTLVHQVAYFTDKGVPYETAVVGLGLFALLGALGQFTWGIIAERVEVRYCIVINLLLGLLGLWVLLNATDKTSVLLFTLTFGFGIPSMLSLSSIIYANYFGRLSIGSIRGVIAPFQSVGVASGPFLTAVVFDAFHSYVPAFTAFGFFFVIAIVLVLLSKKPQLPEAYRMRPAAS
ncbi:MAG: MFS transporter [Dehalococcoidia bacterium]|nr:MFS transporter [Dehalococcoidia bacterium]